MKNYFSLYYQIIHHYHFLNNDNSGEFNQSSINSPGLLQLKTSPLRYHHSHFFAATFDFTSFFIMAFLRAAYSGWLLKFTTTCRLGTIGMHSRDITI